MLLPKCPNYVGAPYWTEYMECVLCTILICVKFRYLYGSRHNMHSYLIFNIVNIDIMTRITIFIDNITLFSSCFSMTLDAYGDWWLPIRNIFWLINAFHVFSTVTVTTTTSTKIIIIITKIRSPLVENNNCI